MKACIPALALMPGISAAESSRDEAQRRSAKRDASVSPATQITVCTQPIIADQETPRKLAAANNSRGVACAAQGMFLAQWQDTQKPSGSFFNMSPPSMFGALPKRDWVPAKVPFFAPMAHDAISFFSLLT